MNTAADALSRLNLSDLLDTPLVTTEPGEVKYTTLRALLPTSDQINLTTNPIQFAPLQVDDLWTDYVHDSEVRLHYFQPSSDDLINADQLHHGLVWKGDKVIVTENRVKELLHLCHDLVPSGHWVVTRTCALIRRKYLMPRMKDRVREYIRTCD